MASQSSYKNRRLRHALFERLEDRSLLAFGTPLFAFDGLAQTENVRPPDPNGDVGIDHYIQMTNSAVPGNVSSSFQVYRKHDQQPSSRYRSGSVHFTIRT